MPYRLSALAEKDLEEIWSYVAADASLTDSSCLSNNLAWVAIGLSSAKASGRSPLRIMSSTIGTTATSSSQEFFTAVVIKPQHGRNSDEEIAGST